MRYSWKIGGPAGYGIKSAGMVFAKTFLKKGYFVFYYSEYPSLIRGGHNTVQIDISDKPIRSASAKIDFLLALDDKTIKTDKQYLKKGGILLYDGNICQDKKILPKENIYSIPLAELAKEAGGEIMRNSVALGASSALLNKGIEELKEAINLIFKKEEIKKANLKAVQSGYNYIKEHFKIVEKNELNQLKKTDKEKILLTGNEATAMGALVGGCKFFSAYPMTPATAILHYLAKHQRETDMIVHQGEDEIGVIHQAIGASFAGARSMLATSGGGFALMNEGLSLSGMTETPLVIIEVIRPAPATGLPTWSDQGDLAFVLGAGHGDFPKVILAPGDPEEAYLLTQRALNISEKYQLPVIILSDKFLGESKYTVIKNEMNNLKIKIERGEIIKTEMTGENYKRYLNTKNGVSPRALPGTKNGEHIANSDEHNEFSFTVEGYGGSRVEQMDKRKRKMEGVSSEMLPPALYGPKNADLTIVSWGSNKGPILDALASIDYKIPGKKLSVNYLHFSYLYPLPKLAEASLKKCHHLLLIECNQSGQFAKLLRQETGVYVKDNLLKYDGRPFWPEEIIDKIKNLRDVKSRENLDGRPQSLNVKRKKFLFFRQKFYGEK
jgi:2-oxoglutarate ferredoxin oxidoreductase subunit alpha